MRNLFRWTLLLAVLVVSACSGEDSGTAVEAPAKEEVMGKLMGTFCGDNSRIKLTLKEDGTYTVQRSRKSPSGVGVLLEKASGPFELKQDEEKGNWSLHFGASTKNSNPFLSVDASSQAIWTAESGYVSGSDQLSIEDPLEQVPVSQQNCIVLE